MRVAHFDKVIFAGGEGINRWYNVVLKEGRKREVRRLWEALGLQVSRLKRISYAGIELGKLPQGGWEELPLKDVNALRALAGLRPETRSVVNEAADKDRGGDDVRREFLKRRQVSHAIERFETRTGFGRGRKKDFEAKPRAGAERTNFAPTASFMDEERCFAAENAAERRFSRNEGRSQGRSFATRNRNGEENKFTRGARLASDRQERSGRDFFKAASFEEKRSSGRKFGDRKFEGRSFGDRKFEGRSEGRSFGDRKFEGRSEGRSFGERKFEGRSEGRSFEGRRGRGSFGRSEGRNGSFEKLEGKHRAWHLNKYWMLSGNYFLLSFYTVVTGWIISYFVGFCQGEFAGMTREMAGAQFGALLQNSSEQIYMTMLAIGVSILVCAFGLKRGVERIIKIMMVLLFLFLVILAVHSLMMKNAAEGLKYYLLPNWQALVDAGFGRVIFAAMGQADPK